MPDKRKYTETLASIETHFIYINNHLSNIDHHLEKINTTNLAQEVKIQRNKDRISLHSKIGGGIVALLGSATVAVILKLVGVY